MDKIRIVKDDNEETYLSKADLITIFKERLDRFPKELEQLKKPQQGKIVGIDGTTSLQPPDEKEIARHEGMQKMLEGIYSMINVEE